MADIVFKGAYYRRVHHTAVAGNPVQAPQFCCRIKKAQCEAFKMFALLAWHLAGGINIHIRGAAEHFPVLIRRIELCPILAVFEPLVETAIVHLPFAD